MPLLAKSTEIDYSHLDDEKKSQKQPQPLARNEYRYLLNTMGILFILLFIMFAWQARLAVYRLRNAIQEQEAFNDPSDLLYRQNDWVRELVEDQNDADFAAAAAVAAENDDNDDREPRLIHTWAILSKIQGSMGKLFGDFVIHVPVDDASEAAAASSESDDDTASHQSLHFALETLEQHWQDFIVKYNKKYNSSEEMENRRATFYKNALYVAEHNREFDRNASAVGFSVELNSFADQESEAIADMLNGYGKRLNVQGVNANRAKLSRKPFVRRLSDDQLPASVDWREQGAVTNVKNQGQCGSCWAFSATGSLEGQLFRKNGYLTSLSEQNLVDCSAEEGNNGCNGGLMDNAFQYIMDNNGIDTEAEYPYLARRGRCHYVDDKLNLTDSGFFDIESGDEKALQEAVATVGPVSIAIDASKRSFQLYRRGVYNDRRCSSKNLDHGVLVVGYGTDKRNGDFWIVKNSWSEQWGEDGYIRMARNKKNMCGVATQASYPKV